MNVPTEVIWQGYIRLPFEDVSGVAQLWSTFCDTFAIAEHPKEGKTKHVHVHMLLSNCSLKPNTLQKKMKDLGVSPGKAHHWISTAVQKGEFAGKEYTREHLLKYLLKGDPLRLKFSKNISPAEVEEAVSSWVEPVIGNDTSTKSSTQSSHEKKEKDKTHYQVCQEIIAKAKREHPDWFQVAITNYFAEDEDEFTLRHDYRRKVWDLMITELNKRKIRTSINELERFYTTIMRNDYETKNFLYANYWRKIQV